MEKLTLGIDIGGTNFRLGAVDENGNISHFEKNSSKIFDGGNAVKILADEIKAYLEKYSLKEKVQAVGIGIPAIVSADKRKIISAPNLKGFDGLELVRDLEKELNLKVFLDRDVNFLLQADLENLGLPKSKTTLGFYVGTGFGNAIFICGRFYAGKNGAAGELGHVPLYDVTDECTCKNVGCAETRCSGKYLEELCKKHFPNSKIRNVFSEHPLSRVLSKFVTDLALPIATEINILDPDYVVISGGVVEMADFPKDVLKKAVIEKSRKPFPSQNLEILFPVHNQQSGILGAGSFAFQNL